MSKERETTGRGAWPEEQEEALPDDDAVDHDDEEKDDDDEEEDDEDDEVDMTAAPDGDVLLLDICAGLLPLMNRNFSKTCPVCSRRAVTSTFLVVWESGTAGCAWGSAWGSVLPSVVTLE